MKKKWTVKIVLLAAMLLILASLVKDYRNYRYYKTTGFLFIPEFD